MHRRSRSLTSRLAALFFILATFLIATPAHADGGDLLEVSENTVTAGEEVTFTYSTDSPDPSNWIGIYAAGNTPGEGPASRVWRYVDGDAGSVTWNTETNADWSVNSAIASGDVEAYLLAEDGYDVLAGPVEISIEENVTSSELTLSADSVAEGEALEIDYSSDAEASLELGIFTRPQGVPGVVNVPDTVLALDDTAGTVTWTGPESDGWSDGGAYPSGEYAVGLFADGDYSNVLAGFENFDYAAAQEPEPEEGVVDLDVLSINIWLQGTSIPNGIEEIANVIRETDADVVMLPEGSTGIAKVAAELGWNYYDGLGTAADGNAIDAGMVSAYPIIDGESLEGNNWHKAVLDVRGHEVAAYGGHLEYRYYVNYLPRGYGGGTPAPWETSEYGWDKMPGPVTDVDLIMEINEASGRPAQSEILVADAQAEAERGRFVIAGGDLNEPSHLDWVEETKDLLDHNGTVIPWQTTAILEDGGFVDAYRELFPNPVTHPGITWPSDNPQAETTELTWAPDADERDRIDYVFYLPNDELRLDDTFIVGPQNSIRKNERVPEDSDDVIQETEAAWPSDHKAVFSSFTLGDGGQEPNPDPDPDDEEDSSDGTETPPESDSSDDTGSTDEPENPQATESSNDALSDTGGSSFVAPLIAAGLLMLAGIFALSRRRLG